MAAIDEAHDVPLLEPPRRRPVVVKPTALVIPAAALLTLAGLVGLGLLLSSRRRAPLPAPSMLPVPHMPAFHMPRLANIAVMAVAQAAIGNAVRAAMSKWR